MWDDIEQGRMMQHHTEYSETSKYSKAKYTNKIVYKISPVNHLTQ